MSLTETGHIAILATAAVGMQLTANVSQNLAVLTQTGVLVHSCPIITRSHTV